MTSTSARWGDPAHVLVFCDEPVRRRYLRDTCIDFAGHFVTEAATPDEALAELRAVPHPLVVLVPVDGDEQTDAEALWLLTAARDAGDEWAARRYILCGGSMVPAVAELAATLKVRHVKYPEPDNVLAAVRDAADEAGRPHEEIPWSEEDEAITAAIFDELGKKWARQEARRQKRRERERLARRATPPAEGGAT